MNYFIIGLFSFPIMYLFDYLQYKNHPLKVYIGFIGFVGLIIAIIKMAIDNHKLIISPAFSGVGYLLFFPFAFLLFRSFFIEIPFNKTYIKKEKEQKLVSSGAYALTRHPGVIWLFLYYLVFLLNNHDLDPEYIEAEEVIVIEDPDYLDWLIENC